MIDLTAVKRILSEIDTLVANLDGVELDESGALDNLTKGEARRQRAERSQNLNLLADRLELAAQLVRVEYWYARGEKDPTNPDRED